MAARRPYFSPKLFDFLRQLTRNNNREWFQQNRARYEADVRGPALAFIEAVGVPLRKLSPHVVADARPVGGSLFRVNRDIRFSSDKSPYKTAVGMSFGHDRGRGGPAPGYYLHLAPGEAFAGGGIHMPETATLTRVRDAIVNNTGAWKRIVTEARFAPMFVNMGDSLKRAPQAAIPIIRSSTTSSARASRGTQCSPRPTCAPRTSWIATSRCAASPTPSCASAPPLSACRGDGLATRMSRSAGVQGSRR